MLWLFYNILFVIGFLLVTPRFIYRMCRRGGYAKDFMQRIGRYGRDRADQLRQGKWVWVQAVSVGEVFVAFRFMEELRKRRPELRFVLSTNTSTGHAIAEKRMDDRDVLIYFPLDFPSVIHRMLNLISPMALVLVECELWPNLMRQAKMRQIPIVLVNGRISEHSYRGYKKVRMFTKSLLPLVDLLCVQSETDKQRLLDLGATEDQIRIMGSAKYEVAQKDSDGEAKAASVLESIGYRDGRLVLLGGSTWPGEESILLDIYKELRQIHEELVLVLAPRHVERTGEVVREIESAGLSLLRRTEFTQGQSHENRPDVFLIDTTGELKSFYPHASVIFVGKSLTQHGGQNVIEPAFYGKPILVGPNMENFPVVIADFREANALIQISSRTELQARILTLLDNADERMEYGQRAADLVSDKAGAVSETVDLMLPRIPSS